MDNQDSPMRNDGARMADIPLSPDAKVSVERRGQIVLIAINRPEMFNRIDPDTFYGLAKAYRDFDDDPTLRAAVLCGHGEHFSRQKLGLGLASIGAASCGLGEGLELDLEA